MSRETGRRTRKSKLWRIRGRRWAANVMWMVRRPSWLRYEFHDGLGMVETGTLRLGFVQVKWTRLLSGYPVRRAPHAS